MRLLPQIVAVMSAICALLGASQVDACSCGSTPDPPEALKEASVVFRGRVLRVRDRYSMGRKLGDWISGTRVGDVEPDDYYARYGFQIEFEVSARWKGPVGRRVLIITGRGGGDCGLRFRVGGEYLVYGYTNASSREYATGLCSRTAEISAARDDLKNLGPPRAP